MVCFPCPGRFFRWYDRKQSILQLDISGGQPLLMVYPKKARLLNQCREAQCRIHAAHAASRRIFDLVNGDDTGAVSHGRGRLSVQLAELGNALFNLTSSIEATDIPPQAAL